MPMKPHKDESQSDFMKRCMDETFTGDRPQEQAVAICLDYWRGKAAKPAEKEMARLIERWKKILAKADAEDIEAEGVDTPDVEDGESEEDYVDRCVEELTALDPDLDEDEAEDACRLHWESESDEKSMPLTKSSDATKLVHKTHAEPVQEGREFILSDESIDRMGDSISSDGWSLESFASNPIALFNHDPMQPVGKWANLRVVDKALRGHLKLAPEGTSPRIDEIRKLIDAGILRAVSVGFRAIEHEPLDKKSGPFGGQRFLKQELVECSLVSVPANANAIAVAKSLKISPATIDVVFAEHGNKDMKVVRRGFTGGKAETTRKEKEKPMSGLSQRIVELQEQIKSRSADLQEHLENQDNTNVSDSDLEITNSLNTEIVQLKKTHAALVESEKILGQSLDGNGTGNGKSRALTTTTAFTSPQIQFGGSEAEDDVPLFRAGNKKKERDPIDYLMRAAVVGVAAKNWGRTIDEARQKIAVNYPAYNDEGTRAVCEMVLRAASAPAMTTVTGWAAELVHQIYTDMMPLLLPHSILNRLSAKGLALNFGRAGRIVIPTRSRTPALSGSFVGEGAPIPVRQGAFTSQTLVPKKVGVISTFTKEMDEFSIPAIEGVLREAIMLDTEIAIDSILIDNNPATVIRPAGLLNGVGATTATAGGGLAALIGDIKALVGALAASTFGNIRSPVWLINPVQVLSASLASATNTGIFPFRDEVGRGTLNNIPFIDSTTVPAGTLILVDAADFVTAGAEGPRMEMSDQATLHMEDTSPADLVISPSTVAAPQKSLFQTDSLALRLVMRLNWLQRRAGTIAWTQSITW